MSKREFQEQQNPASKPSSESVKPQQQSQPQPKPAPGDYDHFLLEHRYPDPSQILTYVPRALDELKNNCLFALDANCLLAPLRLEQKSFPEIERVYKKLIHADRLFVPARALREFGRNRTRVLKEVYQTISDRLSRLQMPEPLDSPMLEQHQDSKAITDSLEPLKKAHVSYKKAVQDLLDKLKEWQWNDPVSLMYRELLAAKVVDHHLSDQDLLKDLRFRILHKLPPGYKDAGKDDEGIGDVAIWHTLMALGKDRQSDVVFVTNETKADWVVSHGSAVLCPSFELVFEFFRETGRHFSLVSFSKFLELIGVKEDVVSNAIQVEVKYLYDLAASKPIKARSSGRDQVALLRLASRAQTLLDAVETSLSETSIQQLKIAEDRIADESARLSWAFKGATEEHLLPDEVMQQLRYVKRQLRDLQHGLQRIAAQESVTDVALRPTIEIQIKASDSLREFIRLVNAL